MPKAMSDHTTSRRLFAGLASSAALALFAPPAPAAEGDAELLRLADQILAIDTEQNRLCEVRDALPDHRARDRFNAEHVHPLTVCHFELMDQLVQMPATTMVGFRAKARVLQRFNNCQPGFADPQQDDALSWSLANDLLGVVSAWRTVEGEGV